VPSSIELVRMPTYSQQFQDSLAQWDRRANDFAIYGFELSAARDLAIEAGSRTEVLLKTAVLPHISPRANFNDCIVALGLSSVDQSASDTLHELRLLYNGAKHDPQWTPSVLQLQHLLPRVSEVIRRLSLNNVGQLNSDVHTRFHQIFWVAVWDHFIGGDSEVQIIAPALGAHPPTLDLIYVHIHLWDQIKATLTTVGTVSRGEELIPADVFASFGEDSDFHQAIVFEGSFRDLIAVLASHERREDLVPSLLRENDQRAMMQAFVLATLDSAPTSDKAASVEEIAGRISQRAVEAYAVPANYRSLQADSTEFAEIVFALPGTRRAGLNGPVWMARGDFDNQRPLALASHPRLPVMVNSEGTLVTQFPG
jgi:hypothetical protein